MLSWSFAVCLWTIHVVDTCTHTSQPVGSLSLYGVVPLELLIFFVMCEYKEQRQKERKKRDIIKEGKKKRRKKEEQNHLSHI